MGGLGAVDSRVGPSLPYGRNIDVGRNRRTLKDEKVFCRRGRGDPPGRPYVGHPNTVRYHC